MIDEIKALSWREVVITLQNARMLNAAVEPPFKCVQTILRLPLEKIAPNGPPCSIGLCIQGNKARRIIKGSLLKCSIRFYGENADFVDTFIECIPETFIEGMDAKRNYRLIEISKPEFFNASEEVQKAKEKYLLRNPDFSELAIRFHFPFRFNSPRNKQNTWIDRKRFYKELHDSFFWAWKVSLPDMIQTGEWKPLPYFWTRDIKPLRKSKSSNDFERSGCHGVLLFKGDMEILFDLLVIAQASGIGLPLYNTQHIGFLSGQFSIIESSYSAVAEPVLHKDYITAAARDVMEQRDGSELELAENEGLEGDASDLAEKVFQELTENKYSPLPYRAFLVPKRSGGSRIIEKLSLKDQVVQTAVYRALYPVVDRMLEKCSLGFRKGRKREELIQMIVEAKRDGFRFVAESDIESFFPSVNREKLESLLYSVLPRGDKMAVQWIMASLGADRIIGNKTEERKIGIPQGSPLAPVCANLFLDEFDEAFLGSEYRLIRYSDDFIILSKTEEAASRALERAIEVLHSWDLHLKAEKTRVVPIDGSFEYLGICFEDGEAKSGLSGLTAQPFAKPLLVTLPYSYAAIAMETVEIRQNHEIKACIPLRRVSEIVILAKAVISTSLITECVRRNIPISVSLESGYHITTIKPDSRRLYGLAARHYEKYVSLSETERMSIAKEIAIAKLQNYSAFLISRDIPAKSRSFIVENIEKIRFTDTVDRIRGYEGNAAKQVFALYREKLIIPEKFRFKVRDRNAKDYMNSLFNYGYYLLFSRVNSLLRSSGLDPYLGFLHDKDDSYESLAADIEELFRARVDRFLISAVNNRVIQAESFEETPSGLYLKNEHRKRFLAAYEAELDGTFLVSDHSPRGPGGRKAKERMTVRELIAAQASVVRRWVENKGSLEFFKEL
ncbi:MAG: CRISPR-associated endonuclease Cas1 [Spirochaetaceae bacterium]|nr:CRISPR-associated endonuclease Cas1 [Spirochaetaceae bacterium]